MLPLLLTTTTIGFLSNFARAVPDPIPTDSADTIQWKAEPAFIGCFSKSDVGNLFTQENTDQTAPTRGICRGKCADAKIKYTAISGDSCWCGNQLPSEATVDYHFCGTPCTNYPLDSCGSKNYFYIYGTDMALRDPRKWDWDSNPLHTGTIISTTSTPSQTVVKESTTVVVTARPSSSTPTSGHPKSDSGISKAGAAAGAVVGVVLAIALGVGAFLYIRKQKRRRVEEEYRRSVAVREYSKKPEPDMRLDPMLLHRRASDGSIADNQDYSRRILKVTNPDG